jgi:hypothetical protein
MSVQLGPTRRKTAGTKDFGAYNFRVGLDIRSTPQEVDDHALTIGTNVYLRADGGTILRNGMLAFGTPPATGQGILARFYQDVKNGSVVTPETVALLEQVGNTLYSVGSVSNTTIGTIGTGSPNAAPMTWVRIQDPNDPHFPSGLTDVIVICTGSGGPYIYDGVNLYVPAGWSQASGAGACAVVNGILWFGQIPAFPNQIFGAGDGITASMETLPAYRNFVLSAPVVGLCAIGTGANAILAVGRNTGLTLLYGTGPSTFYAQDIPFPDGVTAGRSMVSGSGVLYFLGRMAYYNFDGTSTPQRASKRVEPWILNDPIIAAQPNQYPMTGNFNLAWATLYNNRIHLGYCANSSSFPNAILTLDLELGGWTVQVPTPGLSSMILLDAPSDPSPYQCYVAAATTGQVYQWDSLGAFVNGQAAMALDGTTPVLATAQSKYFKVGVPGTNKTLTRYYPEFFVSATPFQLPVTVSTDYGNTTASSVIENSSMAIPLWDSGVLWDSGALWGATGYTSFNAPATRLDFDIPFEAVAFGFAMSAAMAPFIWAGGTGSFSQRGRT